MCAKSHTEAGARLFIEKSLHEETETFKRFYPHAIFHLMKIAGTSPIRILVENPATYLKNEKLKSYADSSKEIVTLSQTLASFNTAVKSEKIGLKIELVSKLISILIKVGGQKS